MHSVPPPEPGDPEELSWALQTAQAKWSEGDGREAVRWVQRAAMTANEVGLTERCKQLTQAAGLLKAPSPSQAATTRMQPGSASGAETLSHVVRPRLDQTHVSAGHAPRVLSDPKHNLALGATVPAQQVPSQLRRTTPSAGETSPSALADPRAAAALAATVASNPAVEVADAAGGPSSLMWESQAAPTQMSGRADFRQALRVCVAQSQDGSLQVVALAEGEAARPGMREALLVALTGEPLLK